MASVKFEKDSEEWKTFAEFWSMYQKYGKPERDNDDYWKELIAEANKWAKGKNTILAKNLAIMMVRTFNDMIKL